MRIYIQALELSLTPEEIKKKISPEKLKQLEGKGILQAYTLAHEGTSHPKVLGEESQVLKWTKAVIHRLSEKIKEGTKFFLGHGNTNSIDGREPVGEIVGSFIKDIGGKLSNIIIGHFPEKENVIDMDVCSMEADIFVDEENTVGDINDISGIALGNSDSEHPAFPGALRLSTVQCFGKEDTKNKPEEKPMTFEEVRKAVKDMNILPSQLYVEDDLKNDRVFSKTYSENETLRTENKTIKEEKEKIEKESKDAVRKINVSEARDNLNKKMEEGFTDKQKTFILDDFDPEKMEDLSDTKLTEFIDNGKKKFAETARLFGNTEAGNEDKNKKENEEESEELTPDDEALKLMGVTNG